MFGVEIARKVNRYFIILALAGMLLSFIFGVFKGPAWMAGFAGFGILCCGLNALCHWKNPERYPGPGATLTFFLLNSIFLGSSVVLNHLFLTRLSDDRLHIPPLVALYTSPENLFSSKLPVGWRREPVESPNESGLRLAPDGFDSYMGAAEVQIRVRILQASPQDAKAFLANFASSLSPQDRKPKKATAFSFSVESGNSMSKTPGIWTVLDVYRFWIPIRQTTFFGIKNGRYLCSVSVTGLKAHSTLHQVLCLGLFETIKPTSSRPHFK